MPNRVYEGDLTVPAGTPVAAPVSQVLQMPVGRAAELTLVIPAGHNLLTGIQVQLAGVPIIPYSGAAFISGDNYTDKWVINQDVNPGQFVLAGYNTDVFPHRFFVRVLWEPPLPVTLVTGRVAHTAAGGIDLAQLAAAGAAAAPGQGTAAAAAPAAAGTCYDASGNVVDCSDPAAVSGPGIDGGVPSSSAAAGAPPGPAGGADTCYDANGNVVSCSDPTAVSGPVIPPTPGLPGPGTPPGTPPPPVGTPPPPVVSGPPGTPPPPPGPHPHPPGPWRHIASGRLSLDEIAHAEHTTAAHIIDVTRHARGMTRAELVAFNHYVREGAQRRMHKGLAFYTSEHGGPH